MGPGVSNGRGYTFCPHLTGPDAWAGPTVSSVSVSHICISYSFFQNITCFIPDSKPRISRKWRKTRTLLPRCPPFPQFPRFRSNPGNRSKPRKLRKWRTSGNAVLVFLHFLHVLGFDLTGFITFDTKLVKTS